MRTERTPAPELSGFHGPLDAFIEQCGALDTLSSSGTVYFEARFMLLRDKQTA